MPLPKKIYTEDDTFNALRRPKIVEVRRMMKEELGTWADPSELVKFLKKHNWKLTEYIQASKSLDL